MKETVYVDMSLRQIKLRSGIALQTRSALPDSPGSEAQFLAAIEGKGVMVTHEGRTTLSVGSEYVVSGFTGLFDFNFLATVIQNFDVPFTYALFTYPEVVKARRVRQAARMKVSIPALVRMPGNPDPVAVTILDLSVFGAMFHTPVSIGGSSDAIEVDIDFLVEIETVRLTLSAIICHSHRAESGGLNVGVSFRFESGVTDSRLLLNYLAYSSTQQDMG